MKEAPADIARLSFLVIEDEAFSRTIVKRTLGAMGVTDVATANNGIEALAHLVKSTPPDVMLVDIIMPEMGGPELLRHLAERNYPGAIILVSGTHKDTIAVAESLANYRELNVLGHIVKPMTANALNGLLAKLE
ncbi:MAG: response regulator [Rhodospirillales bacterium]|nr:response regulator [Rhodospirillales bacterium]MDP6883686.1 response regulator [Rhodospirillales bacterium]